MPYTQTARRCNPTTHQTRVLCRRLAISHLFNVPNRAVRKLSFPYGFKNGFQYVFHRFYNLFRVLWLPPGPPLALPWSPPDLETNKKLPFGLGVSIRPQKTFQRYHWADLKTNSLERVPGGPQESQGQGQENQLPMLPTGFIRLPGSL